LYQNLDTHWNHRGAFIAYQAMIEMLRPEFPTIVSLPASALKYEPIERDTDLARLLGLNKTLRQTIDQASVQDSHVIETRGTGYRTGGVWAKTRHSDAPRAVILCDSFVGVWAVDFLQESFSESFIVYHQGMKYFPDIIEQYKPDVVIYAVTERLIPFVLE
jgi:hypothetical protein